MTPNIPPSGTKSRVETQVRVQLDLTLGSCASGDPFRYDKVGSWKWLKLPKGTATRKRSRKDGKIDAPAADTIYLGVEVTCSSTPNTRVMTCSTCQRREAKRVARKIAARIRPARSDSETNDGPSGGDSEGKVNIIQFNCPDTLDFTSGSVILPLRITCYCRHHREKQGFNVRFTMSDEAGNVVGKGMSPPIMITDDHKSTGIGGSKPNSVPYGLGEGEWDAKPVPLIPTAQSTDSGAPSKRKHISSKQSTGQSKRRTKPYNNGRPARTDHTPEQMYLNMSLPDSASTSQYGSAPPSVYNSTAPPSPITQGPELLAGLPSPTVSYDSPLVSHTSYFDNDLVMGDSAPRPAHFLPLSPPRTAPSSPPPGNPPNAATPPDFSSIALALLGPQQDSPFTIPSPRIHRLIPSAGPTYGGIEVTVLGANFYASGQYECVFGDVVSSSTCRWSDNTLVCILPPSACPGVVSVGLRGFKNDDDHTATPILFTYTDESDRALMELALQVVGLKMTGKIEDAKNVAMRIVGNTSQDRSTGMDLSSNMNMASSSTTMDPRRLLCSRAGDDDFEKVVIDFLSVLDTPVEAENALSLTSAISHRNSCGHTLLHLAVFLKFQALMEFLLDHNIDIDARDVNGFTALHCAALIDARPCVRTLLDGGADTSVVDAHGRTAAEISSGDISVTITRSVATHPDGSDESGWGDGEEDSADEEALTPPSRAARRRVYRPLSRRPSMPSSRVGSDMSDDEQPVPENPLSDDDAATVVAADHQNIGNDGIDEKQAAVSFAEIFQRAWTQFQPPHLMPQMPQLPQVLQLRGVPAWVFPVYVPMPAWPGFLGEKRTDEADSDKVKDSVPLEARSPYVDLRASWERWVTQSANQEEISKKLAQTTPPIPLAEAQTNTATETITTTPQLVEPVPTPAPSSRSLLRRFGYGSIQITDQDIDAYKPTRTRKTLQKEDRMLLRFWIPILIMAIGWAIYTTLPLAVSTIKGVLPFTDSTGARLNLS
ncbi:hypothetical protein BD410DRAFT_571217 [Rickenella mellea]|uniref:IPT/TIG domain-containing protein n=1 Tax=Rickenella mellea TaxID=50990 RepID=A0A4Y7QEY7_9AGAM|nr:hypothetical protein BD410DRAFT_571217 [Rickenella mellea]